MNLVGKISVINKTSFSDCNYNTTFYTKINLNFCNNTGYKFFHRIFNKMIPFINIQETWFRNNGVNKKKTI